MMSFGTLKYFGSIIEKLKKIIVLYQPCDFYLCLRPNLNSSDLSLRNRKSKMALYLTPESRSRSQMTNHIQALD